MAHLWYPCELAWCQVDKKYPRLDILVNNAGVSFMKKVRCCQPRTGSLVEQGPHLPASQTGWHPQVSGAIDDRVC